MACADIPLVIQRVQEKTDPENLKAPLIKYYQPTVPLPAAKRPLEALLQKQPALLGSIQMVNGLFSVAVGMFLAITVGMNQSLYVLLRTSFLTGPFFFGTGLITNLLCKHPRLLPVCYVLNLAGLVLATLEVMIIIVDLTKWDQTNIDLMIMLEVLEICVMGINLLLSLALCCCVASERNRHE